MNQVLDPKTIETLGSDKIVELLEEITKIVKENTKPTE